MIDHFLFLSDEINERATPLSAVKSVFDLVSQLKSSLQAPDPLHGAGTRGNRKKINESVMQAALKTRSSVKGWLKNAEKKCHALIEKLPDVDEDVFRSAIATFDERF